MGNHSKTPFFKNSSSDILKNFVPPPRFKKASFESYYTNCDSQRIAKDATIKFSNLIRNSTSFSIRRFLNLRAQNQFKGLYLDGLYGVGKTHLLASLFNKCHNQFNCCYLSFTELMYFIGFKKLENVITLFSNYDLICIDEFELDDPGNVTMAVGFLRGAVSHGSFVATTSNTLPEDLGKGRFAATSFSRELKEISGLFNVVKIIASDFRSEKYKPIHLINSIWSEDVIKEYNAFPNDRKILVDHHSFLELLRGRHPFHYLDIIRSTKALFINSLQKITDQFDALRFSYFIDKAYDEGLKIFIGTNLSIENIFESSFYQTCYAKKYFRCISRLREISLDKYTSKSYEI